MDNNEKMLTLMTRLERKTTFQLLKEFRNDTNPPLEDVYFIAEIDLKPPVLNTLLYYVFLINNGKLDKPLIKKIANQWKLMGIETISEAMLAAKVRNKVAKKRFDTA